MNTQASVLDATHTPAQRARHLVAQMTLEEKASQLRFDAPAIERLGIPEYNWWNEALHGVARAGTATVFPQAIGLAAIFDAGILREVAAIISTEARAKHHEALRQNDYDIYKGLTMWSPNVNIFRDPRWGRGHETYGEDPYLTARLGVAFVQGLQGDDNRYLKTAACAKHFAVHSGPEALRHEFNAVTSPKDLWETYLPAFEACVKEARVESVMGAYNRTGGEPCCGSHTLLAEILRGKWGFEGHVVSDCWAIRDFHQTHKVTKTAPESAALALQNGCDVNCGNTYLHLMQAHQEGLVSEAQITTAAERLYTTRFRLGMFDAGCPYAATPYEANDCAEHRAKNLAVARKSMVLLKNDGLLPLNAAQLKSIAVIGPNADSHIALYGNYNGTGSQMITPLEGIREAVGDGVRLYYSEGCHLHKPRVENLAKDDDRLSEAVSMAQRADVSILCLGLDSLIEGEEGDESNAYAGGDKDSLELKPHQQKLLEAVCATGKPTVLVLLAGSAMAIGYAGQHCNAVLDAWYPGAMGGRALADLLFGKASPSGKLPVTFYHGTASLPPFEDYAMKNRTYRYIEEEALYPFGYGLTYARVLLSALNAPAAGPAGQPVEVSVTLENTGSCAVEEVLQCYIRPQESPFAVRNHSLCAFRRVALSPGETKTVSITLPAAAFEVVNDAGQRVSGGKHFTLWVGTSQPDARSIELTGQAPLAFTYTLGK
uniref:Glycoside hydrolase family 3 protein n=1 Tax=termite gut metagenome TaxID=433724 RepID=S0DFG7_9ZZZZ